MSLKLITFAIPSYNSQAYLHNAVESLLGYNEDYEIIIVNDGSKDDTLKIANNYAKKYPKLVKVIDKKNGGHGSGVNAGLEIAKGLYYKVLDSDDWIDNENLGKFFELIKTHIKEKNMPDLYILDFIYEKETDNSTFLRQFKENFPENKIFTWEDKIKKFKYSKTMMMHSMVFKTEVLRKSNFKLPEHTFYVDNIFTYTPLIETNTMYYVPMIFYHYHIGRSDQSVQLKNIVGRYDQQIRVMNILLNEFSYEKIQSLAKAKKQYFKHFLAAIMMITQMFTSGIYSKQRKQDLKKLWQDLKQSDKKLYNYLRYRSFNVFVNILPFRLKGLFTGIGYRVLQRKIKLG